MGSSRRRRHSHIVSYACKQKARAWWFCFWSIEVVAGKDRRPQQVDAELFCGESKMLYELLSLPFLDEPQIVQAYRGGAEEV
jgi:hypothetical protein